MKDELKFYSGLLLIVFLTASVIFLVAINLDNIISAAHDIDRTFIHPTNYPIAIDCFANTEHPTRDAIIVNGRCVKVPTSPAYMSTP